MFIELVVGIAKYEIPKLQCMLILLLDSIFKLDFGDGEEEETSSASAGDEQSWRVAMCC